MAGRVDTLVVLRHGFAGAKLDDPLLEAARGLDELGLATAEALVGSITSRVVPSTIVSSPLRRCLQTVRPLAEHLGLEVEAADALRATSTVAGATALLLSLPDRALVCTHGEVISALFAPLDCEKGAFLVVRRSGRLLQPTLYVGPPTVSRPGVGAR